MTIPTNWPGGRVPDKLRGKVSTGVGVGVAIQGHGAFPQLGDIPDGAVRFLLLLRGPGARNEQGFWDFPGGGVDNFEDPQAAALREIPEELSIRLGRIKELFYINHILEGPPREHWVSITFHATIAHGSPAPTIPPAEAHKCTDLRFFTVPQMLALPLTTSMHLNLEKLRTHWPDLFADLID
jgi:8-oxo-dGTP pyrophosphatase MutT (NUDIX family)